MTRLIVVDVFECPLCPPSERHRVHVLAEANGSRLCECERCRVLFKVRGGLVR